MGNIVDFNNFRKEGQEKDLSGFSHSPMVPVEFAVGLGSLEACLQKVAEVGECAVYSRLVGDVQQALIYFISVEDAIRINKRILEKETLSEQEIKDRIDLVQSLENQDLGLLGRIWESFTSDPETAAINKGSPQG